MRVEAGGSPCPAVARHRAVLLSVSGALVFVAVFVLPTSPGHGYCAAHIEKVDPSICVRSGNTDF